MIQHNLSEFFTKRLAHLDTTRKEGGGKKEKGEKKPTTFSKLWIIRVGQLLDYRIKPETFNSFFLLI